MGLFGDAFKARRMKDPVDGTAQVVGSTQPPDSATSANVNLTLAAQLNHGGGGQVVGAGGADVSGIVEALQQQYPGAQIEVEGAQVQGDRVPASGGDDHVAQLERLAKLRDSGALTEQEFEREKARILGQ